ncbi:hypothetical protein Gohar_024743, partial [Gossypium harknessii]|nr:hypothetical protein [Gossypium harknessii]
MTYTRSTCGGDSRKIGRPSTRSISRCGSVGTSSCQRRGVGNIDIESQDEGLSILGHEMEMRRNRHLLHLHQRARFPYNLSTN